GGGGRSAGPGGGGGARGAAGPRAAPARRPPPPPPPAPRGTPRYPPGQARGAGAHAPGAAHPAVPADADDLAGLPVVVADLHSALAPVALAIAADRPGTRVVYAMTDGAALPAAFSRSLEELRRAGLVHGCVTTGPSFGGDLECVSVHTGLLAARLVLNAEVVVATQGPGNLGSDTRWGFSGVAAGEAVNAAGVLGGRPIASLRVSQADPRERHRGLSHHSRTAYGRVALAPARLPVPRVDDEFWAAVWDDAATLCPPHERVDVDVAGLAETWRGAPVGLSSMGRGVAEDPAYFLAAAVAGRLAARLLEESRAPVRGRGSA
ncbi:MAG: DUF3866 family protein, partial [Sporichthyaceae bacterium]